MSIYHQETLLYWVHDETCHEPKTDGYVGVTSRPERRMRSHRKRFGNRIRFTVLFRGTRDECFAKEFDLRPEKDIGWNIAVGGRNGYRIGHSTSQKGKKCPQKGRKGHGAGVPKSEETRRKISESKKGTVISVEHRQKISKKLKGKPRPDVSERMKGRTSPTKGVPHTEEAKAKISKAGKGRKRDPESVKKGADKMRGRPGRPESADHLNIKNTTCVYCGMLSNKGMIVRWHGEKCKKKP
jgi:hypothetical protein